MAGFAAFASSAFGAAFADALESVAFFGAAFLAVAFFSVTRHHVVVGAYGRRGEEEWILARETAEFYC